VKGTSGPPMAGRTALITGSAGGIGKATALGLAAMGAQVLITGSKRSYDRDAAVRLWELSADLVRLG
jgi:retinol dehydrogenase-14